MPRGRKRKINYVPPQWIPMSDDDEPSQVSNIFLLFFFIFLYIYNYYQFVMSFFFKYIFIYMFFHIIQNQRAESGPHRQPTLLQDQDHGHHQQGGLLQDHGGDNRHRQQAPLLQDQGRDGDNGHHEQAGLLQSHGGVHGHLRQARLLLYQQHQAGQDHGHHQQDGLLEDHGHHQQHDGLLEDHGHHQQGGLLQGHGHHQHAGLLEDHGHHQHDGLLEDHGAFRGYGGQQVPDEDDTDPDPDPDDQDDFESDPEDNGTNQDYCAILNSLCHDWVLCEISHRVSKTASNKLWDIANKYFFELYSVKTNQGISKKIPKMQQLRNKAYQQFVPPVKMDIGYQCKDTGEIKVVKDVETTPVSKYPPSTHRRIFEIAYVEVRNYIILKRTLH